MRHAAQLPAYSPHSALCPLQEEQLGKEKKKMESQFSPLFTSAKARPNPICEPRSTQGCLGLVLAAIVHINSFHMAEEGCFPHECCAPCTQLCRSSQSCWKLPGISEHQPTPTAVQTESITRLRGVRKSPRHCQGGGQRAPGHCTWKITGT